MAEYFTDGQFVEGWRTKACFSKKEALDTASKFLSMGAIIVRIKTEKAFMPYEK